MQSLPAGIIRFSYLSIFQNDFAGSSLQFDFKLARWTVLPATTTVLAQQQHLLPGNHLAIDAQLTIIDTRRQRPMGIIIALPHDKMIARSDLAIDQSIHLAAA